MKTPSPTKLTMAMSPRTSPTRQVSPASPGPADHSLAIMGHSMISRVGDPESEMNGINLDLRLITGRMAQTLHSYEGRANSLARDNVKEVENHLDEIDNPILKVQIKTVLDDYKRVSQEREDILYTLEKWFGNCADEFLDELEEFETQFEGEETLSDNINQAKDIIAKIKFINGKIVEFQSNGMSTQKLIAQKKTLEDELMKKKVIVDNVQSGSDHYVLFKQRIDHLVCMIKDCSASDIDKALLDMKLTEATEQVINKLVELERTSRRAGVLFKNVKELEYTNSQLADDNSFLKQRLSMVDKHFKEAMNKKVRKLDESLDELGDVKYLKTKGRGSTTDDINRRVLKNSGMSMEMEMIENYQDQISCLDRENRELITKTEAMEEECEELKEEVKTLSSKLTKAMSDEKKRRASEIAIDHPLVKLDDRSVTEFEIPLSVSSTSSSGTGQTHERQRRGTLTMSDRRKKSVVSTITIQDGKELEALRMDNDFYKVQNQKLKRSLNSARRKNVKPKRVTRSTQAMLVVGLDGDQTFMSNSATPQPEPLEMDDESEYSSEEDEEPPSRMPGEKPPTTPKKSKKKRAKKKLGGSPVSEGDHVSEEEESSSEESEEEQLSYEEEQKRKQQRADSMVADLKKYVNKQEKEKMKGERKKRRQERAESKSGGVIKETSEVEEPSSSSAEEIEIENEKSVEPMKNANETKKKKRKSKSIIKKQNTPKKGGSKQKQVVTFQEPMEIVEEECPTFERLPTPKLHDEESAVENLMKIKEELQDFLSYGQKFISSIHDCITDTADDDLVLKMDNYSDLEQKISSMEESLNILLYGVDLGISLGGTGANRPNHSPLPFENKLYFQENLSKYLREKYPTLNVSAIKIFDPELDPIKNLHHDPIQAPSSPTFKPYAGYRSNSSQGNSLNLVMPLTTTPEPKPRMRKIPNRINKRKHLRKQDDMGRIEQIMEILTASRGKSGQKEEAPVLDERSFSDIVDHVMPKEVAIQYMKLIQPTQDTLGKVQYNEKLKRGVTKVKDLLDLVNINSNMGVIKGMPSNKLGEPRARQTKVHKTNLEMTDLIGQQQAQSRGSGHSVGQYRHKIARNDERVRAMLEDYSYHDDYDLRGSSSLTIVEVPFSARSIQSGGKQTGSKIDLDKMLSTPKEDMFILSQSSPNMDTLVPNQKRSTLPLVTKNLLPVVETNKKFPARGFSRKGGRGNKPTLANALLDHSQEPPRVSDILNMGWEKRKLTTKLPSIHQVVEPQQSFP